MAMAAVATAIAWQLHKLVLHVKCKRKRTLHMHACTGASFHVSDRRSDPSQAEGLLHIKIL